MKVCLLLFLLLCSSHPTVEEKRYACVNPVCRDAPESAFYPTWSALQHHIRATHPPACPHDECAERTFSSQKGLRAHLKLHEQRALEDVLSGHEDGSPDKVAPPQKRRRGGEVGRDWKCDVGGCTKDFKSVRFVCVICKDDLEKSYPYQKKALTTHHAITHLGRRDFVCAVEGCGRAFGYKHILQRHQARRHSKDSVDAEGDEDGEQHADADAESSDNERPRRKKRRTQRSQSPDTWAINEITGVAYEERAATTPLKCPHPVLEGLLSATAPVENRSLWGDAGPCEYVFGRAYDLRRHLRAVHGIVLDKEVVDGWARRTRDISAGRSGHD
jgi:general transcription factor IIIA